MEGFHGSKYLKTPKIKVPPGMKAHPLMIGSGRYQTSSLSPNFDSYSENLDLNASILRHYGSPIAGKLAFAGDPAMDPASAAKHCHLFHHYGGSGGGFVSRGIGSPSVLSPLSGVENLMDRSPPGVYRTPVKAVAGEEVLVMDGVPVSSSGGGRSLRSVSDSSSSSSASSVNKYKSEICHSCEDSGNNRYSSKCQVAHGKENLRPSRLSTKNRTEAQMSWHNISSGQCFYSPSSSFPQIMTPTRTASSTTSRNTLNSVIASRDWCPQDDGIEVTLPRSSLTEKSPSRESVITYIDGVLSGRATERLPVFSEFC
ncbi:Zinc finger, CCCH-type [Trema orientale]|uniref:Zinc finger, CCCH-type n=1 Tax=Trema orientale TaxID=63057 RepID=A0A2P5BMN3_TREOI|nr:Zinc finger, CCCH-type [Trema orientale]